MRDRFQRGKDLEEPRLRGRSAAEVPVHGLADRVDVFAQEGRKATEAIAALGERRRCDVAMRGTLVLEASQEGRRRREILA